MPIWFLDKFIIFYGIFYLSIFFTDYSFLFPKSPVLNISGFTAGLIFAIFIRWLVDKKTFFQSDAVRCLRAIYKTDDKKILFYCIIFTFSFLSALSIARHMSFSSSAYDLGIFDQAIWNTLHGDILFSSLKNNTTLLGDHFEPILFVFVPMYWLWPNVFVLLIVQSLLLASAIIPLYLIARDKLKEKLLIFAFIIAYILSKPMRGVAFSDFHPECFILPLLFWAYYFLIKGKNLLLLLSVILLLGCKEDVSFIISGLGIFAILFTRRKVTGLWLFILGIVSWIIVTKLFIPYYNEEHVFPYMNRLPFGMTYAENVKAIIVNPALLFKLFLTPEKIEYMLKIFAPLGFFSFLSPVHYILIAIPLLRNLMPLDTNFSGWFNITSHYTAALVPFVFIAAIYGAGWLVGKLKRFKMEKATAIFIIICSLFFYGKTDAGKFSRFLVSIDNKKVMEKLKYLKIVPKDASLAANCLIVPHLTHRKYTFEWAPRNRFSRVAEYLVIDKTLLDYLTAEDFQAMGAYFKEIEGLGYKKIFESPDKTFSIYKNFNFKIELVEETIND